MRYLFIILIFSHCNLTSNIPQQYDVSDETRKIFYLKKHLHYQSKYDSLKKEVYQGIEAELAAYARLYYLARADQFIHSADSINKLILKAELTEYELLRYEEIKEVIKRRNL